MIEYENYSIKMHDDIIIIVKLFNILLTNMKRFY